MTQHFFEIAPIPTATTPTTTVTTATTSTTSTTTRPLKATAAMRRRGSVAVTLTRNLKDPSSNPGDQSTYEVKMCHFGLLFGYGRFEGCRSDRQLGGIDFESRPTLTGLFYFLYVFSELAATDYKSDEIADAWTGTKDL